MPIHHAVIKRAEKAGIILTEQEAGSEWKFEAIYAKTNKRLYGQDAKYLVNDMLALIDMSNNYASFSYVIEQDETVSIRVKGTNIEVRGLRAQAAFDQAKKAWQESRENLDEEDQEAEDEVDEEVEAEIEEEDGKVGSVVGERYRLRYVEQGHPTHCGDWLATTLINFTTNKAGINVEILEEIAKANGLDISKYGRVSNGWQGRLRMTTRNLLAKVVYFAKELKMPLWHDGGASIPAPQDWLSAQKFKAPKVKTEQPVEA